jgi:predicted DNA-binding antitoxin AbrB/MazE fold protein
MPIIQAIYENGVFRPKEPVDLPESSEVEVEVRSLVPSAEEKRLDAIYAILGDRFESGESDVAARHDEHQP